jgi:hypothetical protein
MTEQIPMTGSRGQPLKIAQYLEEGKKLMETVRAYRAAKAAASEEAPVTERSQLKPEFDNAPVPPKRKSYPLPRLETPTPIPGYPLNPPQDIDLPNYETIGRVKATRAAQAARRGKRAPLTPSGPSRLVKRHDVRTWTVAE